MTGTTLTCPKCGLEQPVSPECQGCGLIFAKYNPDAPSRLHKRSSFEEANRQYRLPIGPGSRSVRVVMALGLAGVTLLLVLNGLLGHGFQGWTALVVLSAVTAYFALSSFLETISRNRYYTEAILFIALLLGVRIGYDEHFRVDDVQAAGPRVTGDARVDLATAVEAALGAAREHLGRRDFAAVERCCLERSAAIEARLAALQGTEQVRAEPLADQVKRLTAFVMADRPWDNARVREFGLLLDGLAERLGAYRSR